MTMTVALEHFEKLVEHPPCKSKGYINQQWKSLKLLII